MRWLLAFTTLLRVNGAETNYTAETDWLPFPDALRKSIRSYAGTEAANTDPGGQTGKNISFYLVDNAATAIEAKHMRLSHLKLSKRPLFTSDDMAYYKPATHSFRLTDSAYQRLVNLPVPVQGTPFVVCIQGRRVYMGAFWVVTSSVPWEGISIVKPMKNENVDLQIFCTDPQKDFRGDKEILETLRNSGKLKER